VTDSDVALGGVQGGYPRRPYWRRSGSHPRRLPTRTLGNPPIPPDQALASTKAAMGAPKEAIRGD
jgi:hypothetical protein